jgi:predicted PurR-regulated permease PerM
MTHMRLTTEQDTPVRSTRQLPAQPNAQPRSAIADPLLRASQIATISLFVIALLWAAYVSQPIVVPVLLAYVIGTIVLPAVRWLELHGAPRIIAAILLTIALLIMIVGLMLFLSTPIAYWLGRASDLGVLVRQKLEMMNRPLAFIEEIRRTLNSVTSAEGSVIRVEQPPASVVTTMLAVLKPAVSEFMLFNGALLFYLIYREKIRSTAVLLLDSHDARLTALRAISDIDENMSTYFSTFTVVNFCLGVVTVTLASVIGLPNPLLWGVLAGVLNYVPYIGPAIVTTTLAVVGLLTFPTLGEAAAAPLIFIAIVTIEGQFLTPTVMGDRLQLNPFAVFLAIAFCMWLWGPIGAFLAVPLLMALMVSLGHVFAVEKPNLPK